jgi:hypothetical protein
MQYRQAWVSGQPPVTPDGRFIWENLADHGTTIIDPAAHDARRRAAFQKAFEAAAKRAPKFISDEPASGRGFIVMNYTNKEPLCG